MEFSAHYADYNFVNGKGINTPTACAPTCQSLIDAAAKTGREVGSYVLFMVIADETDALAEAKWQAYREGADVDALSWMADQGGKDVAAGDNATARYINLPEGAINFNMGTLVGSYGHVAAMLDDLSTVKGCQGVMLTFDDFLVGLENFGTRIQPLMACRAEKDRIAA